VEILCRIEREDHGAQLRKLGWEVEEARVRIAREIKRNLFKPAPRFEGAYEENSGVVVDEQDVGDVDFRKLEIAYRKLEDSINKISMNNMALSEPAGVHAGYGSSTNNSSSSESATACLMIKDSGVMDEQRGRDHTPGGNGE
jgi:hypothetical protein